LEKNLILAKIEQNCLCENSKVLKAQHKGVGRKISKGEGGQRKKQYRKIAPLSVRRNSTLSVT